MQRITLQSVDSTQVFLKNYVQAQKTDTPICVLARSQTNGKGQFGTSWATLPNQNLTCSFYLPVHGIACVDQFMISMAVALTIVSLLEELAIPDIQIKWPNDILCKSHKVCGILIDSIAQGTKLKSVIVGIGLNVNQTKFYNLPRAISLKNASARTFAIDRIADALSEKIQICFSHIGDFNFGTLRRAYESCLFRKDQLSFFVRPDGTKFSAIPTGITQSGRLELWMDPQTKQSFDLKSIRMIY